jgi:DNA-binding response OmpR family regulator
VFLASTSQQAFNLAKDLGFSVVLVDLDLGREDGLLLIREIHAKFPGLPIIAISDAPRKAVSELAQEFGAVEILQKPVTPEWRPVVERVRALRART